jgi:hypothetical protein
MQKLTRQKRILFLDRLIASPPIIENARGQLVEEDPPEEVKFGSALMIPRKHHVENSSNRGLSNTRFSQNPK